MVDSRPHLAFGVRFELIDNKSVTSTEPTIRDHTHHRYGRHSYLTVIRVVLYGNIIH